MPVDVQMRADAELGAAWRRLLDRLPPSVHEDIILCPKGVDIPDFTVRLEASGIRGVGPTPAAALDALTEALANR